MAATETSNIPPAPAMPVEAISPAEARLERWRKLAGFILAPIAFIALLLADFPALSPEAHRLAAVMAAVVTLWITEALPMPVTALLGASLCVILRVAPAREVFAPFADPLMFLFIGSFILARAIFIHGLDRRLAFGVLSIKGVGARPGRILFAFGAVTAFSSAWISNTATTAMMFAIGMSILAFLFEQERTTGVRINRAYATGLMLITSFAASVGGLATPIGTPPNVIGLSFIRSQLGIEFPFFKWCLIGVPIVIVLYVWMAGYFNFLCRAGVREIAGSREMIARERLRLGGWTRGQVGTVIAFGVTVVLWVAPGIVALTRGESSPVYRFMIAVIPEGVAALIGAVLLFLLPGTERGSRAITWEQAVRIDWGVILLYGGGFALGVLSFQTGLAEAIGVGLTGMIPGSGSAFGMLVAATVVAVLLSETTSNTASANMVVPVVIALARSAGVDPLMPALGATFGASLGFMLPVSTPCNAIVYGSGHIPIGRMIRYGFLLDVVGAVVVIGLVWLLVPLLR
ncbi:MAG TPA: DASS family sodium-coupled anion symporter [Tepidisphaeraceae bacterium]|nr:DASS family sodium-coupled anion symporter [Tepidisphaeraceae bacterium]